jgi:hypothetical protein
MFQFVAVLEVTAAVVDSSTDNNELNPKSPTGQLRASNVAANSNNEVDGAANFNNNNTGSTKALILSFVAIYMCVI